MYMFKTSLKEASWVFLLSRCLILAVGYIGILFIALPGTSNTLTCTQALQANPCIFLWYRWDAEAFATIAHQGYAFAPSVAYYPLWPLLIHFGGLLLGGTYPLPYYLAGLLLANLCFFFVLVLFYYLLAEDFEPSLARRALFYLAFYPYAMFFFVGYSEALFVLLSLAVFLLLRRKKMLDWWLAGLCGFLAALTRSTGILLSIPFFVVYIQRFWLPSQRNQSSFMQKLYGFAPILLIPAGVVLYMAYLGYTKGNPFLVETFEGSYWHRHFSYIWYAFAPAVATMLQGPFFSLNVLRNGLDLTFTLLPITALILGWKRLPLHYNLFALAIILFSLCFAQASEASLTSQPRYMMSAFPVVIICALWGKRTRFDQAYLVLAIAMLAINTLLFATYHWVA